MEAWLTCSYADLDAAVQPPQWHIPTAEEVGFAQELVQEHLEGACKEMLSLCAGTDSSNGLSQKERLLSLISRIKGCTIGLNSNLPDFEAPQRTDTSASLVVPGQFGALVGTAEHRALIAKALVTACRFQGAQDPQVLQGILEVANNLLCRGMEEYKTAADTGKNMHHDEKALQQPAIAGLLLEKEGSIWRAQRPRWLLVERTYVKHTWRASQQAYRWWATLERPTATLDMISNPFKALFAELVRHSVHTYRGVRNTALKAVSNAMKRYPCLSAPCLPFALAALTNLPRPSPEGLLASLQESPQSYGKGNDPLEGVLDKLLTELPKGLLNGMDTSASASAGEEAEQDALVKGATGLLTLQGLYRLYSRSPVAMAAVVAALLGSAAHTSEKAVDAITSFFLTFSVGFIRPPQLNLAQLEQGTNPKPVEKLLHVLLGLLSAEQQQSSWHWRYTLMTSATLMFVLPPVDAASAEAVTRHFMQMMLSQLQSLRILPMTCLLILLNPNKSFTWREGVLGDAISRTVRDVLAAQPDYCATLLKLFEDAHPSAGGQGEDKAASMMSRFMAMNMDEKVAQVIGRVMVTRLLDWPQQASPEAVKDQLFSSHYAHLILLLSEAAPQQMQDSLKGPLQRALQGVQQDVDRPRTCAAAEALSGLLACSATYQRNSSTGGSAWEEWVEPLLTESLAAAPLDLGELWSCSVRFALYALAQTRDSSIVYLLDAIAKPLPEGASSAAVVKRLKCLTDCLAEITTSRLLHASHGHTAGAGGMRGGVTGIPGSQVDAICSHPEASSRGGVMGVPGSRVGSCPPDAAAIAARNFQRGILKELPSLVLQPGEAVRQHVAGCAAMLAVALLWEEPPSDVSGSASDPASAPLDGQTEEGNLRVTFLRFLDTLRAGLEEGTARILSAGEVVPDEAGAGSNSAAALVHEPSVATAWCALQFVAQALKGAEGMGGPFLAPHLLSFLPSLLKLQEVPQPELQRLTTEAKAAAALLKYLPLSAAELPAACAILQDTACADLWPARAAALVYAQYLWFRHVFLLSEEDSRAIQGMTVELLADKKLEVQELAATTLSGLLQGLPEKSATGLRDDFLGKAEVMFPTRAQRRKSGAKAVSSTGAEASAADKHAVVLGLKAFVLASPYDVPAWLPGLLLVLTRAAGQPPPIKTSVRKALAEFRRTHEEAALAEAKRALEPDQWDALQSVASPASYFA